MPKVMLVEDQARILRFLEVSLKRYGYEVITATSANQAVALAQSTDPDLILLDIIIPGMDGFQLLQQLKSLSRAPIIATSARSDYAETSLSLGAAAFLSKPFKPDELVTRIKSLLPAA
jgi:two-component system KDP operon response regulator KdpE